MSYRNTIAALGLSLLACAAQAQDVEATFATRTLTPETALKAAQAALASCRDKGFQTAVAVTDRGGVPIALLRDRFAGAHTPESSVRKAYTAAAFNMDTLAFGEATSGDKATAGLRQLSQVLAVGGGLPIEAAGSMVGAIGVSGAPGGDSDQACAQAGIDAILMDLEF